MKKPEILAPAGSIDSLYAAVKSGCDAIYLGSGNFNARANAANFTFEQLCEGVRYAHERGVKIYQTLNTVVFDSEIPDLIEEVKNSAKAGVDALIIQDLGVARIVKEVAPTIERHASTQMALMNRAGLLKAAELGFTRGVVARELSEKELQACKNDKIEIEAFIHGALCMSVSGQCFMSVMLGGRSGNRGQCAQPCRLPFASSDNTHALSLKDVSLIRHMDSLKAQDIAALKIEGRMKRPEYVAATVTACRKARDGDVPDLELVEGIFSRSGFTEGYFNQQIDKDMFGIRRKEDVLSSNDSIKRAAQLYKDEYPHIGLTIHATLRTNALPSLTITDCDGHTVTVTGDSAVQVALNKPTTEERATDSLSKLGGTPYFVEKITLDLSPDAMVPVSVLNALRRQGTQEISTLRTANMEKPYNDFTFTRKEVKKTATTQKTYVRLQNAKQFSPELIGRCDGIILPYQPLFSLMKQGAIPAELALVELPRVSFQGQHPDLLDKLTALKELGINKAVCHNLGMIDIAKNLGFTLHGGFGLNLTNSIAMEELKALGFTSCDVSLEIPMAHALSITPVCEKGIVAYGHLPNMTFRNCPIKASRNGKCCGNTFRTLTDRKDMRFTVDCGANGNAELFNAVPLYLADRKKELTAFDSLTLYFSKESSDEVLSIITAYEKGIAKDGEKTRGIYYRGLTE